ncbi:ATP binding cassette subfamily B MDR:TAP [Echinococcus multilocularis]|uniref:ATP binding cassette subfamily B MDR:TAP n=1 Tax=Echinococcus multilocularis TaxID=6211 RepID=A0A068YEA9_ECHMU|nr:ATP binding cassette subfamily B MDR:TAP [Echinococcus multilocularis]
MSCGVGSSMPVTFLIFSDLVNDFLEIVLTGKFDVLPIIHKFAIIGAVTFFVGFLQMFCLQLNAKLQSRKIRLLLYRQILAQDVAWFDEQNVGSLITKLTEGVEKIETGIGEKLGIFVQCIIVFISGLIIGFTKNWRLSLVACAIFPPIVIGFGILSYIVRKYTTKTQTAYERANSIASEALGAIRTIFAFEGQKTELKRYSSELDEAEKYGIKMSTSVSGVLGMSEAFAYILISVTFYYGMVVFTMLIGAITIGQALSQLDSFNIAITSASEIFPIIDRIPPIGKQEGGTVLEQFRGDIKFENIYFSYPTRKSVQVLNGLSLSIQAGQTVAIVGASGSGKSTVIQLIQRFYDANDGQILIDGVDIRELDLVWFREQLGVVSQEPVLFAGTVAENIRLGSLNATNEEVEEAAKMALVHEFVSKLPEGYNTFIAEGGGAMSGGQKQRLAIARALIRKPRILLLDEATSALDTRSEKYVQRALDNAKIGRTVVMVAHRLSTVRDADSIIVVNKGRVVEVGNHNQLMALKDGVYAKLVKISGADKTPQGGSEESEEEDDDFVAKAIISQEEIHGRRNTNAKPTLDDVSSASDGKTIDDFALIKDEDLKASSEILRMNAPEMSYMIMGLIISLISGGVQASFTILITEIYNIFPLMDNKVKLQRTSVLSGVLAAMGIVRFLCLLGGGYLWGVAGARLTKRCRVILFNAILNQEVGWFDSSENQPGTLTGCLAADVPTLQNISGRRLASLLEVLTLIIISLIIAFVYSWQIALVALAYFPVLIVVGAFNMTQYTNDGSKANVKGAGLAFESLSAAKTIFSLGAEAHFVQRYELEALPLNKKILLSSAAYAVFSALANSLSAFQVAGVFYAGGNLMESKSVTLVGIFRAYSAISFAAQQLGYVAAFAPDSRKAKEAAGRIFAIINRVPDLQPDEGDFPTVPFKGSVSFNNVHFRYPTRKKIKVLQGFTYAVKAGTSVALVGQSGCGKSTVLQLVQRFYDPTQRSAATSGAIYLDGMNMRDLAPTWIRRHIGVVSQEPNLLDLTIGENIAYGLTFDEDPPSMEQIIEAAKQANAHNFIANMPQGYDTPVGPRGSRLSGGQKQRIAIARALVRKPRLLVLDEATAALDNESERVVQAALDEAMRRGDRTTLVVAHRLTTVENCDCIVVLENGRCVESGSPATLMEARGAYYSLHNINAKT